MNATPQQTGPSPAVMQYVQRIVTRAEASFASGGNVDSAMAWFRAETGAPATATWDQLKTVYLPNTPEQKLAGLCASMNA